jgi:DNA (cytosine-5)-methyltransferase 1
LDSWQPQVGPLKRDSLFQVIDFFCGSGGTSLGFAAISRIFPFFEIIGGCDIDNTALATFQTNFNAPGINMDVRQLVDSKTNMQKFVSQLKNYNPRKNTVVIGCAPCQGFSSYRKKNWHKKDERNTLPSAFAQIAVSLKPTAIVMENVPDILSAKYWNYYEEVNAIFRKAGYTVHKAIYNTAGFGVPQERFRALIMAMKKDFVMPEPILAKGDYYTVRDVIGNLPKVQAGQVCKDDPMHRSASHRKETIDVIKAVPKDGGSRPPGVGPKCLDRVKGYADVYGRLSWSKPAITITHYARNPASGRFVHPEQNRGLTMREASLLQSFPKGFVFKGTFDAIFKQIGEAVPPKFSSAVAVNTLIELLSEAPDTDLMRVNEFLINAPVNNSFSSVIAGLKRKQHVEV